MGIKPCCCWCCTHGFQALLLVLVLVLPLLLLRLTNCQQWLYVDAQGLSSEQPSHNHQHPAQHTASEQQAASLLQCHVTCHVMCHVMMYAQGVCCQQPSDLQANSRQHIIVSS
jgi:hypothetical protein